MKGLLLIEEEWKGKTDSKGTSYMKHIVMGMDWLNLQGCDAATLEAWCVHPLVQDINDLEKNFDKLISLSPEVVALAVEYRNQANYFSTHNMDKATPKKRFIKQVELMLKADKLQNSWNLLKNRKDHENYNALSVYFDKWFEVLNVTTGDMVEAYSLFNKIDN